MALYPTTDNVMSMALMDPIRIFPSITTCMDDISSTTPSNNNDNNNNKMMKMAMSMKRRMPNTTFISSSLSRHDVWYGRGKVCNAHPGNIDFKQLVHSSLEEYRKAADNKDAKSAVVTSIINTVRRQGRFVRKATASPTTMKQSRTDSVWEEVPEKLVREKIGSMLRDELRGSYKSCTETKRQKRLEQMDLLGRRVRDFAETNKTIASALRLVNDRVEQEPELSEQQTECLFVQANMRILDELKRNATCLLGETVKSSNGLTTYDKPWGFGCSEQAAMQSTALVL